jgi:hypothetical protein
MKSHVRDIDHGFQELKAELKRLAAEGLEVKVGILGDTDKNERTDGPLTNVEIGAIHEFGGGNVPQRSFLRSTVDLKQAEYRRLINNGLRKMVTHRGGSLRDGAMRLLELVGMKAAADVKARITEGAGIPPPLAPSTIARKGSSRPLVDTGQLLNSISWKVGPRQEGEE